MPATSTTSKETQQLYDGAYLHSLMSYLLTHIQAHIVCPSEGDNREAYRVYSVNRYLTKIVVVIVIYNVQRSHHNQEKDTESFNPSLAPQNTTQSCHTQI